MLKKSLQALIDKCRGKNKPQPVPTFALNHQQYGRVYTPLYNLADPISAQGPAVFNAAGQAMQTFFLRDFHMAHVPYYHSNHFMWDRYNFGLETHFYTHGAMLETMGQPKQRYGLLIESQAIVPEDYRLFEKHPGLNREFDAIFTYSEKILETCDNAKFFPACAEVWYGKPPYGGTLSGEAYLHKHKNISLVSSNKVSCNLHQLRLGWAHQFKHSPWVDTYGTFDGGPFLTPYARSLTDYRYSFAVENAISPYYFTERLTSCFASMTIPIYVGATSIHQFFNPDGIIQVHPKDYDHIEAIIQQCDEKDYEARLPAILDNYQRVQPYLNIWDYLFENHLLAKG